MAIIGIFCPWVSVKNELEAGGTINEDVTGWQITGAVVGSKVGSLDHYFWPNTVDGFLVLTTKKSANFTPYVELFGCIFMLMFGIPLAFAGKLKAACILLFIGAFFVLVGALAGLGDYGMGRGSYSEIVSGYGVTAVEQSHGYGIYMCLIGAILGLVCAAGELAIWVAEKRGRWEKI